MALTLLAFLLVVNLRPDANFAAAVGPKVDGAAQDLVTLITDTNFLDLARLEADRANASHPPVEPP